MEMWISRSRWDNLLTRIEMCEDAIRTQKANTEILVRKTAKRILEQPDELLEEIKGLENIDSMVQKFIYRQ